MSEASPPIRYAATVLVLRASGDGPELLMLKRAAHMAFYGGAWVFPGGSIDPQDRDLSEQSAADPSDVDQVLTGAARRAAARELHEEAGLEVNPDDLLGFSRWVTPPGHPRRFDTFYFAVTAPDQPVRVDPAESDDHTWLTPHAALTARARGEIQLPPPTFVTLSVLAAARSVPEAFAALGSERIHYVPRALPVEGGLLYLYEGDAGYATSDIQARGHRHRLYALQDGWRYERSSP